MTVTEDRPLNPDGRGDFVQVRPQAATLRLRPGSPARLAVQVAQASLFPVDIYFLMDLSWSMRNSQVTLARLGGEIISGIKKKTENLRTGFGSFVEKNVTPFTSAVPEFNCIKENPHCEPPYSFYHKAKLGNITAGEFGDAVLDSPHHGDIRRKRDSLRSS